MQPQNLSWTRNEHIALGMLFGAALGGWTSVGGLGYEGLQVGLWLNDVHEISNPILRAPINIAGTAVGVAVGSLGIFVGGFAGVLAGNVSYPATKYVIGPVYNTGVGAAQLVGRGVAELSDLVSTGIDRFTHRNSDNSTDDYQ